MNLLLTLAAVAVTYGIACLLLSVLARATEEREDEAQGSQLSGRHGARTSETRQELAPS